MIEMYQITVTRIRLLFWRAIASILGWIIRWKSGFTEPLSYARYFFTGFVSYFVGKAFASVILRVLLS